MNNFSSFLRFWAIFKKEFIQIKRDYVTYIFLIGIPFIQVVLFGHIVNTDAKNLPTVILAQDHSPFTNSLIQGFKNTGYFNIIKITQDVKQSEHMIRSGAAQFIITIPNHFGEDIIKNKHPHLLVEGDATDPVVIGNAFNAATTVSKNILDRDLQGPLGVLKSHAPLFQVDTHALYNPGVLAQYHTIPGLLVTILTASLAMMMALSITTEFERGTLEMLLITPINSLEVIMGKIVPNLILGYILFFLMIALSLWMFHVPFVGSKLLLICCALPYIIVNLTIGIAISTVSKSQLQAANMVNAYVLPSMLLSGFMFPFYAMPHWAQMLGDLLPPTHFLRITTEIMVKGSTFSEIWPDLWPILVFLMGIVFISFKYYRKTLD